MTIQEMINDTGYERDFVRIKFWRTLFRAHTNRFYWAKEKDTFSTLTRVKKWLLILLSLFIL